VEENQTAFAPDTATDAPVTTDVVETALPTDSGTAETVAETAEEQQAREVVEEKVKADRARSKVQKRIDEIIGSNKQKDKVIADLVQRLSGPQPQQAPQTAIKPPTRDQFNSYEDFVEAKADFRAAMRVQQELQSFAQAQAQYSHVTQQQIQAQQVEQNYIRSVAEFEAKTPDFRDVVERDDINIPDAAANAIKYLPDAPQVLYALGKNPAAVQALWRNQHNPVALIAQLGQLGSAAPSLQISKAPPPGKTTGGRSASSADSPPENPDAYMAWAEKHMKKR
jgi:hypothetical protein